MKLIILFLLIGFVVCAGYAFVAISRIRKRRILLSSPFPKEWAAILCKTLPPYQKLSPQLHHELHDLIRIFISEKSFEGCGGLTLTDEIRVTWTPESTDSKHIDKSSIFVQARRR